MKIKNRSINKTRTGIAPGLTATALAVLLPTVAQAGFTDGLVDGNHGVLRVHGSLTESACRLDMASADQTVDLGNIGTASLHNVGDRGAAVAVPLRLQDCLRTAGANRDSQGNLTWAASQPVVSFTFTGVQDEANTQLVEARGVTGMGLRLKDQSRKDVVLGQKGQPLILTPGNNVVTYYIAPERTRVSLQPGAYSANVNFRLSYE